MPKKRFVAEIREGTSSENRTSYWLVVKDYEKGMEVCLHFSFRQEVVARMATWFNTAVRTTGQEAITVNFGKAV